MVAQTKPRDFLGFVADVNARLMDRAGVSYTEVVRSIHPGGDAPRQAFDGGVDPGDFVSGIIIDENFLEIAVADNADAARAHNLIMAAIAEFAYASEDWHRSDDGKYFSRTDDHTLTIRAVADPAGRFGFGLEIWAGIGDEAGIAVTSDMGEPIARIGGYDISTVVERAYEHLASASDIKFK